MFDSTRARRAQRWVLSCLLGAALAVPALATGSSLLAESEDARFSASALGEAGALTSETALPYPKAAPPPSAAGTLAFGASTYTVAQSAGAVQLAVNRVGGTNAKISVVFGTGSGSALAGNDYAAQSDTLRWGRYDGAARTISIAISNAVPFTGSKTFTVALSGASGGASIGTPATATVTINGSGSTTPPPPPPPPPTSGAQPYIQDFSPSSGPAGTVVTVNGSGFTGLSAAWVGSAHDAGVSVVSDSQARITIPADATTGAIALFNASKVSFSATAFTVTTGGATPPPPPADPPPPPPPVDPVPPPPPPAGALSVRVQGRHFIDASGNAIQLRGVNYSGYEFAPIQGWSGNDPSGAQAGQANGPKISALQSWKVNTLRIPLNEASWLGYSCVDADGTTHNPDPAGNYKQSVQQRVAEATAVGIYVILDLHWTAPGNTCPMLQSQMADADHSLAFWTSVATMFKSNPAVMFELFNEPFLNFGFQGDAWQYMMKGTNGSFSSYPATGNSAGWKEIKQPWAIASYQQMIDTVRATGATNVVLVGTMSYAQDFSGWLAHRPTDPLGQMAAVWHPYPTFGKAYGTPEYAQPNGAPAVFNDVANIQAAGIPVIATETGDRNVPGTPAAPLVANITAWADLTGMSLLGWGWNVWGTEDHVLIRDANGTPTDGYGKAFHDWMVAH